MPGKKKNTLPADALQWKPDHVAQWLKQNDFPQYEELFVSIHRIDGKALLTLTERDLRLPPLELSILGDIKRLNICLKQLKINNLAALQKLGISDELEVNIGHGNGGHHRSLPTYNRFDSECSSLNSEFDCDGDQVHHNGHVKQEAQVLQPEYFKLLVSFFYMFGVFLLSAFVMTIVHDRVPDMEQYPPLPDIVLDNVPYIPWAFDICELTGMILLLIWATILFFHKHRFILMRRMFSLGGTVFMLRCVTMLITSLSVPGRHLECQPRMYGTWWAKLERAITIWKGFGMSLQGVRTCGDYMFSGHTVVVTLLNFFITEYTPRRMHMLHTMTWVMNFFAIFFILAAHEHYSIDVFVAFYISSRLFLYYHSMANTQSLLHRDRRRIIMWFPLFSFFESKVTGSVPNEYEWPPPIAWVLRLYSGQNEKKD